MTLAAININLDSFGEAYGFPEGYSDPTFGAILDRLLSVAEKWHFKYSVFVIGKDLKHEANRAAIASLAEMGHEIGNHSWSHPLNLGSLPPDRLLDEVKRSHDAISACTGKEPKGFIAPGWSTSARLREILMDLEYEYDTSTWPSLLMYPALFKMMANHVGDGRFRKILHRRDLHYPLFARRTAHVIRRQGRALVSLPLPTNRWRLSCWHTTAFMFGWKLHRLLLRSCLQDIDFFYYLVHPADLAAPEDLDPSREMRVERMGHSLEEKHRLFEAAIEEIVASGRKLVTMRELSREVARR